MSTPGYVLDNRHAVSAAHHRALSDLLDPWTCWRLAELGLDSDRHCLLGAQCLEVAAGHGSVSRWLADQVGQLGHVVATDLMPDYIPPHPRLTTVAHDLTAEQWPAELDGGGFDLIVARLVLSHRPERREIFARLVKLLAPGGAVLVESWTPPPEPLVLRAPTVADAKLYQEVQQAVGAVFSAAGTDRTWGLRQQHLVFQEEGLDEVDTPSFGGHWAGGGPGLRAAATIAEQLRPQLLDRDITAAQVDRLGELADDPGMLVQGLVLYSTSGRRAR